MFYLFKLWSQLIKLVGSNGRCFITQSDGVNYQRINNVF